jgi:hypothetical protein
VTPTILISHAAQRIANPSYQCRAPFEQTFQDGFSPVSCVVVEAQLQPQVAVILLIFVIVSENSTDLTSFRVVVRFVVVVEVQLRRITVPSFS